MSDVKHFTWPLSVRLIHWSIAGIVLLDMFILEEGDPAHRYLGYLAVFFIALRLYWGFKKMVPTTKVYLPFVSFIYYLIWFSLLALAVSGWMMGLDYFWGDETLDIVHSYLSNFLGGLVIIHLLGVFSDAIRFKRKTWMRMIK